MVEPSLASSAEHGGAATLQRIRFYLVGSMSKISAAQRERKRVRRGERKAEQAELVDKGKRSDSEIAALKDRVAHFTGLANRAGDFEHQRDQTKRECVALQKEVEQAQAIAGNLKAQLQKAQERIVNQFDLIAHQEKELKKLRSEDRDAPKLRRRLQNKSEELETTRQKYNRLLRSTRTGKFKDEKLAEEEMAEQ